MGFTYAPAVQDYLFTDFETIGLRGQHGACKIDPRDHRKPPDNGGFSGDGQSIFVIDGGMADRNRHIPLHQKAVIDLTEAE